MALVGWSILLLSLISLELTLHKSELVTIAINGARAAYTKDLQFRLWNANHGGVYVPVTEASPPNPYLSNLFERDLTTPSGRKLTLINPDYMIRQVHELGRKEPGIWGHISGLKPLRPENAPDEWEKKALLAFERGEKEVSSVETIGGKQYLRLMRPLMTEEACLACHSDLGYKKGDVRGGISVTVPVHDIWTIFHMSIRGKLAGYGLLWVAGMIAIVISSRQLSEKTVRIIEDEKRYRILFNTAHDAVFITEAETGIVLDANIKAGELTGMPLEAIIGMELVMLHPEEVRPFYSDLFREVVESGDSCSADLFISGNGGRRLPVELSVALSETAEKKIVQFSYRDNTERRLFEESLSRNITEIRKAEKEKEDLIDELQKLVAKVSSSQKEWTDTFDSITDVIFISDMECNIIRVNRAIEKMLDLPIEAVLNQKCHSLFQWMHPAPGACSSCVCTQASLPFTIESFDSELNRFLEVTVLAKRDSRQEIIGLIHIVRDITEQKKLEEQLVHAQKMEAVGQLAGGVAHDFNNVLTAIISCASLLKIKLDKENPLRRYVDYILDSSERGSNLVKGLLTFSRKQVFYPVLLDLNDLVRGIEDLLQRTVTEDIELKVDLSDDIYTITADKNKIEQILINLVANARDAMPSGGTIIIRTELLELDSNFAKIHGSLKPGKYAFISVSDTGEGIHEEIKERVFEPFFTTKEVGKGTGLGLSIVYGIVKQHEGYVSMDSMPGLGTTVKVYLPLVTSGNKQEEEVQNILPEGGSETVLLAEDNADVRNSTKELLEEFGYTVMPAVDGEEALSIFNENKDRIGLVVLDVIMPKMNGKEVYEAIKKVRPDAKTILMSSYTADILQNRFMLEEGLHFISKPFSPVTFLKKIREVLDV